MTRHDRLVRFIERQGWVPGDLEPLAGDASHRRYSRLRREGLIIMDAPPQSGEDVRPFVAMTNWLRGIGYSAPEIVAADLDAGFLVLEDLGDALFADLCANDAVSETALYENAVDLLADLSHATVPTGFDVGGNRVDLARYDDGVLSREADLFLDWYLPGALGRPIDEALQSEFRILVRDAIAPVQDASSVVVLRDYHAENLIWLPKRRGTARTGLLDYQDALAGHPAYDLVSLLEDARRDTGTELRDAMIRRYLDATA
ncbi:MAG: phosphotransferase, partial [Pseudomonadota bacterium]